MGPVLGGVFIEKIQYTSFYCGYDYNGNSRNVIYGLHENQFASRKIESRLGHDKTT